MHERFNASIEPSSNAAVDCILIGMDNAYSSVFKMMSLNFRHVYQQDRQPTYKTVACSRSISTQSATRKG
jgi:hypothetical protein